VGQDYRNKKITVMGLGLNGGGLACVRYFAESGAIVTATDLRSEEILRPSMELLKDLDVRYVLGEHRIEDFSGADIVIKNPAVPADSPYLKAAAQIETDLSVFLSACKNPIIAVTGSKGKSSVVSALYAILKMAYPQVWLGGNITVSPLTFLKELGPDDPIILELSSWQLRDLRGRNLLHPEISIITNIMNDHQNMYSSFSDYVDDKKEIYRGQKATQHAIFLEDEYGREFASECSARPHFYRDREEQFCLCGAEGEIEEREELLPEKLRVPGRYFRLNCLIAAATARLLGVETGIIRDALAAFKGVPHRMELVRTLRGVRYYNDTTATIPEAMAAGILSFNKPVRLIAGGKDKELDYHCALEALKTAEEIYLLKGSATNKIVDLLKKNDIAFKGPYPSLEEAFKAASKEAQEGDALLMSPGATSFGMFVNEFGRGDRFRELAEALN